MKFLLIALIAGASVLSAQQDAPAAPAAAPPVPPKRFLKLDKNQDGRLSLDEFESLGDPAKREKRFRKLDVNHDGFLSPEEFVAGRKTAK